MREVDDRTPEEKEETLAEYIRMFRAGEIGSERFRALVYSLRMHNAVELDRLTQEIEGGGA